MVEHNFRINVLADAMSRLPTKENAGTTIIHINTTNMTNCTSFYEAVAETLFQDTHKHDETKKNNDKYITNNWSGIENFVKTYFHTTDKARVAKMIINQEYLPLQVLAKTISILYQVNIETKLEQLA
ncbi:hypothetical protein PR048_023166 [Dryococelus australis]|uniref:Uncharacterized protein n=1 Tax=Dryococelus australis TaxID=614101 RepID=A0ABQ9GTD4_9NEOP|nr:hypothetical protein PR048_023166 [Dryococelus australis]